MGGTQLWNTMCPCWVLQRRSWEVINGARCEFTPLGHGLQAEPKEQPQTLPPCHCAALNVVNPSLACPWNIWMLQGILRGVFSLRGAESYNTSKSTSGAFLSVEHSFCMASQGTGFQLGLADSVKSYT
jgi:hypothetical protein